MDSRDLFTLGEENKRQLDFRWIMHQGKVPITEDMVFLGIPKRAKSVKAARAFIQWFFRMENQGLLLEYCKENKINENIFGISDGFSSLSDVTEQIFPHYYPELIDHMPVTESFMPPLLLPAAWPDIKERVVLPYLHDRSRAPTADEIISLDRRLSDWIRMNR